MHPHNVTNHSPCFTKVILAVRSGFNWIEIIFFIWKLLPQPRIDEDFSSLQKFCSLFYPIGDLILIPGALIIVFKYKGGSFSKNWIVITLGFLVYIIADLVYVRLEWDEFEYAFMAFDHLYIASSMILAIGAIYLRNAIKK